MTSRGLPEWTGGEGGQVFEQGETMSGKDERRTVRLVFLMMNLVCAVGFGGPSTAV